MTSDSGDEIPDMPLALSPCGLTDFAGKINRFALLVTKQSSVSSAATVKATILSPSFRANQSDLFFVREGAGESLDNSVGCS